MNGIADDFKHTKPNIGFCANQKVDGTLSRAKHGLYNIVHNNQTYAVQCKLSNT